MDPMDSVDPVIIPVLGIVFSLGSTLAIVIVWLTLNYRRRRRLMELYHVERMAAIERGMELPPLPLELIAGSPRRRRGSLLPGLVWSLVGLALIVSFGRGQEDGEALVVGLVPLGVGLAYLIYYFVEGRKVEQQQLVEQAAQLTRGSE